VNKIRVIALTTFRELIREKFFLVIVFVAVFLLALSLLLGELSFDEVQKILADIGFLSIQISSLGIALFSGSTMLSREIEKQTCLLMLSRPITRTEFLLGKYFGIVLLITLLNVSLSLALLLLLGTWSWSIHMMQIAFSLWLEALVLLSLVFVFSIILRPVLSVLCGLTIYFAGSWLEDLSYFAKKSGDAGFENFSRAAGWIFPNFYRFNWKNYFFLEKGLAGADMAAVIFHYIPWAALMLIVSTALFRRKDIV
jgi:Cu-processing system permease protein